MKYQSQKQQISSLILSFPRRLRILFSNERKSITDILRRGINNIPQFPLPFVNNLLTKYDLIETHELEKSEQNDLLKRMKTYY